MSLGKNLWRGAAIATMGALGVSIGGVGIAIAGTAVGISGLVWGSAAGGAVVALDKILDVALENITLRHKKWWQR